MKQFIDAPGTFKIKVPITWRYSLHGGKVHTFQEYEIWKSDAFQISIRKIKDENEKIGFLHLIKSLPVTKIKNLDYYNYPDSKDEEHTIKSWTRLFDDQIVLFTFTISNNVDENLDNRTLQEKINLAEAIISEFVLIDESHSSSEINSYRFNMFLQGVGATALMLNKAVGNKAFIEATCLISNQIDALLRIGIILKTQIIKNNTDIEIEWIYQGVNDKKKSEKDIYKKALELRVIDQIFFDELYQLYENRNRVIHRFIISEITVAEVEEISYRYYMKSQLLNKIIYEIESQQIELGIGMTRIDDGKNEIDLIEYIEGKIGKYDYFENKDIK